MTLTNQHHGAPPRGLALSTATRAPNRLLSHPTTSLLQHATHRHPAPVRPATLRLTFGHMREEVSSAGL